MEHVIELDGIVTGFNVTEHCITLSSPKEKHKKRRTLWIFKD